MTDSKSNAQNSKLNLVLTGFMGTGKSTIGRLAAARLERPFIDMDEEIAQRAGQPIPAIFAAQGEAAFRRMERDLCRELAGRSGLVIATGGGTLLEPGNREAMTRNGVVICLMASPEALVERLRGTSDRPLLHAPDPTVRIRELLAARTAAYAALPYHLDTSALSPEATAEAVLELWHKHST
jgi:shikimate kinase